MAKLQLTDEQKKEVVDTIVDYFKYSKKAYGDYYDFCSYLRSFYRVELPNEIESDLSEDNPGLVPPDMFIASNQLLSTLDAVLFSADPFLKALPGPNTPPFNSRCATSYLRMAAQMSELEYEYAKTIRSAANYACGVGYVDFEEHNVQQLQEPSGEIDQGYYGPDFVSTGKIVLPRYVPCSLVRTFPDPTMKRKKSWVIHQSQQSFIDLIVEMEEKENGRYDFDPEALKKLQGEFPQRDFFEYFPDMKYESGLLQDQNFPIELLHWRGWLPIRRRLVSEIRKQQGMEELEGNPDSPIFIDAIATVANRNLLIQFETNEWHFPAAESFIFSYLLPQDEDEFYPVGNIQASQGLFLNNFYLRNQILRMLEKQLGGTYVTDDEGLPTYLQADPGIVHHVEQGRTLKPLEQANIPREAFLMVGSGKDEMVNIFGSNQYSAGQDPTRKETATGINVLHGAHQTSSRFQTKMLIHTGLEKIARRYLEIGQLFLKDMPIKLHDSDEVIVMNRKNLFGEHQVISVSNEFWSKPVQQNVFLKMIELYGQDPYVDPVKLRRKHFASFEFDEIEELVPDPAEKTLPIEKENMLMQQGVMVPVLPQEDHELHLKVHMEIKDSPLGKIHMEIHRANWQAQQKNPGQVANPSTGNQNVPENDLDAIMSAMKSLGVPQGVR